MSRSLSLIPSIASLAAEPEAVSAQRLGGKAARLVRLARLGVGIPRGWVLDADRFRDVVRHLPEEYSPAALLKCVGQQESLQAMAKAREAILKAPLDRALGDELAALWDQVGDDAPWGLAVRSSATCEDDDLTAMAGLASTLLGVRGREALQAAVRQVWASALLPRALGHLASRGLRDLAMGVVVQVVVPAEASGVMFTRPPPGVDPGLWASDERLINATLGLGAPLADGAVSPDMIRFAAHTGELRGMTIAHKTRALRVNGQGVEYVPVPEDCARKPALSSAALDKLAALADRLEALDPSPQDVEFAIEKDQVWVVQARPVVGYGFPEGGDAETVWSRANVGEALPGVATPLTWSVARGFSNRGFQQAFGSLGCRLPKNAMLVGNIHGRFYLNLTAFMQIAAQVPGLDPQTLQELGGGNHCALLARQVQGVSRSRFYARLPITAARLASEQLTLSKRVDRFLQKRSQTLRLRRKRDLSALSNKALASALREAVEALDHTGTLMLSCASASLAGHLALKAWIQLVANGDAARVAQVLSAGLAELESARPGLAISNLAALARFDAKLAEELRSLCYKHVDDVREGPFRRALVRFLDEFGDRALREAELSAPRWREDQSQVFSMIATALRMPANDTQSTLERTRNAADQELALLRNRLQRPQFLVLRTLVQHARTTTQLRERMRAAVTVALSEIRRVSLEVDRRLLQADSSLPQGAAFFCTVDELIHALETDHAGLGHLVRLRWAEYKRDEARPEAPVTFVGRPPPGVLPPVSVQGTLRGLPASSGVVEGVVRILRSGTELKDELRPGEILVARTTDVGLTPLFLVAAGVVTELGGPLSHAALVAREYGVPTVVNVAGATVVLHNGERVRVDGTRGTVERLAAQA